MRHKRKQEKVPIKRIINYMKIDPKEMDLYKLQDKDFKMIVVRVLHVN